MSVAIVCTPTAPRAKIDACRVNVTGADSTTESYLLFDSPAGVDDGKSYSFVASSDGKHEFNSYIFPAAGSWTIRLRKKSDNSDIATQAVSVS